MYVNKERYLQLFSDLQEKHVCLVAVSKTKPAAAIEELYALGHRDFGENYVQELLTKSEVLPKDIHWHFIGHLQTNKVKQIIPFVYLIHGVDSEKLLGEIQKQAQKTGRRVDVLLQMFIAAEESKFGFNARELKDLAFLIRENKFSNVRVRGLMGMASFTENTGQVRQEFLLLKNTFEELKAILPGSDFTILSMGMSNDYELAQDTGTNMVRIGSLIFGSRN
jgi:pyridoxal phosphate enzyme (YggS family)